MCFYSARMCCGSIPSSNMFQVIADSSSCMHDQWLCSVLRIGDLFQHNPSLRAPLGCHQAREGDLKFLSIETLLASLLARMSRFVAENVEVCSVGYPSLLIHILGSSGYNFRITRIVRRVSSVRDFRGRFVERQLNAKVEGRRDSEIRQTWGPRWSEILNDDP